MMLRYSRMVSLSTGWQSWRGKRREHDGKLFGMSAHQGDSPGFGRHKFYHVEGSVKATVLVLTPEGIGYLQDADLLHNLVGVMAQNTVAASKKAHVWSTERQKIEE